MSSEKSLRNFLGSVEIQAAGQTACSVKIAQMFELKALETGLSGDRLGLSFRDVLVTELMDREGRRVHYFAEGIITGTQDFACSPGSPIFYVSWVDPWGYPRSDERSFTEIQITVVDEMAIARHKKNIASARARIMNMV